MGQIEELNIFLLALAVLLPALIAVVAGRNVRDVLEGELEELRYEYARPRNEYAVLANEVARLRSERDTILRRLGDLEKLMK